MRTEHFRHGIIVIGSVRCKNRRGLIVRACLPGGFYSAYFRVDLCLFDSDTATRSQLTSECACVKCRVENTAWAHARCHLPARLRMEPARAGSWPRKE